MYARLQSLLQWRISLFQDGRLDDLAGEYLYPYPVYIGGRQQVLRSAPEMAQALQRLRVMAEAQGIVRFEARLRAVELPRQGRFRAWVSQHGHGADGALISASQFVHYCRQTELGIKTEMSDHPECEHGWSSHQPRRALA